MKKYHVSEININNIDLKKLEKNNFFKKTKNKIFLSDKGLYKIIDDNIYNYKLIEKEDMYYENFLDKYTLFCSDFYWRKNNSDNIPYNHKCIEITDIQIKLQEYTNTTLNIEIFNGKIIDVYFLSKMFYNDHSFKEDISLFMKMIL
jgi:hypothetical protein